MISRSDLLELLKSYRESPKVSPEVEASWREMVADEILTREYVAVRPFMGILKNSHEGEDKE